MYEAEPRSLIIQGGCMYEAEPRSLIIQDGCYEVESRSLIINTRTHARTHARTHTHTLLQHSLTMTMKTQDKKVRDGGDGVDGWVGGVKGKTVY